MGMEMDVEVRMPATTIDAIGRTPLVDLEGIHIKLECSNPSGSVKDRIARFMIEQAAQRGDLRPGDVLVEATSGNTGIALAYVGRELGHHVMIFMPEHMSVERRLIMENLGASVRLTPEKGGFEGAVAARDAYRGRPGYFVPDQFGNPDNALCHQMTTGREILDQVQAQGAGPIRSFVAGVGTGGTLMGVARALRAVNPGVRIVAVEPDESAVMSGGPAGAHGIMGIGDGFIPDLVDLGAVDEIIRVTTDEAHEAAELIRERHGYCVGRSSGANMVAARLMKEHRGTVVTLWPDCANRYVSVGLQPPSAESVRCSLRARCHATTSALLDISR